MPKKHPILEQSEADVRKAEDVTLAMLDKWKAETCTFGSALATQLGYDPELTETKLRVAFAVIRKTFSELFHERRSRTEV